MSKMPIKAATANAERTGPASWPRIPLLLAPKVENEADGIALFQAFRIGHLEVLLRVTAPHAQEQIHGDHGHFMKK